MAEFNQLVAEMCIRREHTPQQPLPGAPNNPPQARQEPVTITVTDLMSKILMPTQSLIVHEKTLRTVPALSGELFVVEADSLPNGYAYLVIKAMQIPTDTQQPPPATQPYAEAFFLDHTAALSNARIRQGQIFAVPLVQNGTITVDLVNSLNPLPGVFEVDVLLIGSEDAIVT